MTKLDCYARYATMPHRATEARLPEALGSAFAPPLDKHAQPNTCVAIVLRGTRFHPVYTLAQNDTQVVGRDRAKTAREKFDVEGHGNCAIRSCWGKEGRTTLPQPLSLLRLPHYF